MTRGLKLDPTTLLLLQLRSNDIPEPRSKAHKDGEYYFHPTRKWRFDFAWPEEKFNSNCSGCKKWSHLKKVAIEIDGGAFAFGGGKHMQPRDLEKLNTAASMGWKVYRFTPEMIRKSQAIKFLLECS